MFWYIYLIIHIVTCFPFFFLHPYFHAYMYTWRYIIVGHELYSERISPSRQRLGGASWNFEPDMFHFSHDICWLLGLRMAITTHANMRTMWMRHFGCIFGCIHSQIRTELFSFSQWVGPWGNGKVSPKDVEDAVELLRKGMELTGWCLDMPMVARACLDACPSLQHKTAYTHYILIYIHIYIYMCVCCVVSINHLNMCYLFINLLMLFISLSRFLPLNLAFSMVFSPSPLSEASEHLPWPAGATSKDVPSASTLRGGWRGAATCYTDEPRFAEVAVLCL